MPLLIPLVIFLIACVVMIVVLTKTKPPTASDTVEAYCDAILRNDLKTLSSLSTIKTLPTVVANTLSEIADQHQEVSTSYNPRIVENWDDKNSTFESIAIALTNQDEEILFTCQYIVNQWSIVKIKLLSKKAHRD